MILENLAPFIGALLKHIIGVLLLCWRRMLRAGLIAFGIGVVVVVLITVIVTGEAIPSLPSLIVALLLGLGLAYGVAMTVLIEELILGVVDLIRMIEGDISAGAHIVEVVAEREVGQVGQGLRRLIGLPVSKRAPVRPGATLPPLTRAQAQPQRAPAPPAAGVAAATVAAVGAAAAATAQRVRPTTPPATVAPAEAATVVEPTGEPVPADRLPRISWTYEHEAIRPPAPPASGDLPNTLAELAGRATPARVSGPFLPPDVPPTAPEPAPTPEPEPVSESEPVPEPAPASELAALEEGYEDERLTAPANIVPPEGPAEPAERVDEAPEDAEASFYQPAPVQDAPVAVAPDALAGGIPVPAPAPSTIPLASEFTDTQPVPVVEAPQLTDTQPVPVVEAPQAVEPAGRSDFARRSMPLSGSGATLEAPGVDVASSPRSSAPESGLWERLSNALINRAGAPSGPFAPAPPLTSDEPATDDDAHEPGTGGEA